LKKATPRSLPEPSQLQEQDPRFFLFLLDLYPELEPPRIVVKLAIFLHCNRSPAAAIFLLSGAPLLPRALREHQTARGTALLRTPLSSSSFIPCAS
jgi:hypothetical protein